MKKLHQRPFFSRFDPSEKSARYSWCLTAATFLMLLLAGGCLGLMSLYFSTGTYKLELFEFYTENTTLVLLNVLPFQLVCLLVWFLSNRAWLGFLSGSAVCLAYSFAEYWKLMARDDAIYAEDLSIIKEALQMSESYAEITWQMLFAIGLVAAGTVVLFLFFRGRLPHWSLRVAMPLAVVIACVCLYRGPYTSAKLYDSFPVWNRLNRWVQVNTYISRGGIYPFIHSIPKAFSVPPEGYSAKDAKAVLEEYESDALPADKKVSVITLQLEAFTDFSALTDQITGEDPYAAYHQLKNESYSGTLVNNVFAGGTIDTERCFLTGFSKLGSFRRDSWSYARWFGEQGYTLQGAHSGYQAFYNRLNVNANLGLEDYRFIDNYYKDIVNGVPKDRVLFPDIAEQAISAMEAGNPVFSFNITYQNHGPYAGETKYSVKEYVPKGKLEDYDYNVVNNYLSGIEDTGNNLLQMVDTLRARKEPVVLVVYGDHKPWLGDSGRTYTALGIDLFETNDESFYNYYNTEYLIWANDAAKEQLNKEFRGQGPMISPCYLMNLLFEQCGWEGPSFLKLSNEVRAALPVITNNGRCVAEGALIPTAQMTDAQKTLLDKLYHTQYYLMRDAEGKLP